MDFKTFSQKSLATENKQFKEVGQRLEENHLEIFAALNQAILAAQNLDHLVKKKGYYGKAPKYYQAPLFKDIDPKVVNSQVFIRSLHAFMGVITEAGEGLEALAIYNNTGELDEVNLSEELGDIQWYSAIGLDALGTSFGAVWQKIINKLAARHGKKYNDKKVMQRDLAKERQILEEESNKK